MEKLIREMLSESQNQHLDTDSALVKLKSEMLSVKNEMSGSEQRSSDLQHDVRILEKVATDSLRALVATKREMQSVQDEIALMYTRSGQQPLNLFQFASCKKKSLICLEGKSKIPFRGGY